MCRRWPTPSIVAVLDMGDGGAEEGGDVHPQGLRVGAAHGRHRARDAGCLLGTERPLGEGGQLDPEEGVGVLDGLLHRTR